MIYLALSKVTYVLMLKVFDLNKLFLCNVIWHSILHCSNCWINPLYLLQPSLYDLQTYTFFFSKIILIRESTCFPTVTFTHEYVCAYTHIILVKYNEGNEGEASRSTWDLVPKPKNVKPIYILIYICIFIMLFNQIFFFFFLCGYLDVM